MNVLVTGAGVVGTETAKLLADRGDRVVLLDLKPDRTAIDLVVGAGRYELAVCDVADTAAVDAIIAKHAITDVIHTAAILTRPASEHPARAFNVNLGSAVDFLERQRLGQIRRVVLASSTTIAYPLFDRPTKVPVPEDFACNILSQRPRSIYSTTKLVSEFAALSYRDQFGIDPVVLRYAAIIGAWPSGVVGIPARMLKVLLDAGRDGKAAVYDDPMIVWSGQEEFVDSRDVARANVAAIDAAKPEQGVYNVAAGELHTFDEIVEIVRGIYPNLTVDMKVDVSGGLAGFAYPRPGLSDTEVAAREIGFRAKYTIADSIQYVGQMFETWKNAA